MNRKYLSADGLIKTLRQSFSQIKDTRGDKVKIDLPDSLMTAYAAFSLKHESFNSFFKDVHQTNLKLGKMKTLFHVKNTPSDTRLREIIDPIDHEQLRPAFNDIFRSLQRGKVLENFTLKGLDNHYAIALDGTQTFKSDKIHCKRCLVKTKSGKESYSHQLLAGAIVHPEMKQVIPLMPEPIENTDGQAKNDCERNASKRFLEKFRKDHPKLPVIILEDGLASNRPHIETLNKYNCRYILGAKPGDHKYLFEWIKNLNEDDFGREERVLYSGKKVKKRTTQKVSFSNEVPLNASSQNCLVNFITVIEKKEKQVEQIAYDQRGMKKLINVWVEDSKDKEFTWVTDIEITQENCMSLMEVGRRRWAIENETFNTLKNRGFCLERNFGHGNDHLATNLSLLMILAFLVDQIQELCCKTFQQVLASKTTKKSVWRLLGSLFELGPIFNDWEDLWQHILSKWTMTNDSC